MTEVKGVCRYCVASCGMIGTVDPDGRLVKLRADPSDPVSAGFACIKGIEAPAAMNSPDRIVRPLKRMPDGTFREIPLAVALDEISRILGEILAENGGETVGIFKGTQ